MSKVRYAKFPLDCDALKAANEKVWKAHPELESRKLTMSSSNPEPAYRQEWMDAYIAAGGRWQETKAKLKPGEPLTTCQRAAETPAPPPPAEPPSKAPAPAQQPPKAPAPQGSPRMTPEQRFERTRERMQKNREMTKKNLDHFDKRLEKVKNPYALAEALAAREKFRRYLREDEEAIKKLEEDKKKYGPEAALRGDRGPSTDEEARRRDVERLSKVLTDFSKAAQAAKGKEDEAQSAEEKGKWAEAEQAVVEEIHEMQKDLLNVLQQKK